MIKKSIQEILNYYQSKSIDQLEQKTTKRITECFITEIKVLNYRGCYRKTY